MTFELREPRTRGSDRAPPVRWASQHAQLAEELEAAVDRQTAEILASDTDLL